MASEAAWLSPWQAVQLLVSRDPTAGPEVAEKISEPEVSGHRFGYEGVFLEWLAHDHFENQPDGLSLDAEKLMTGVGGKTVGAFRRAIEKIETDAKAGRIEGHRIVAEGPQEITSEFSAYEIDFRRGALSGERVRFSRESVLKLCAPPAPPAPPKKRAGGRPKMVGPGAKAWLEEQFQVVGLPHADKTDWRTVQDVIDALREEFLKKTFGLSEEELPTDRTLRRFVNEMIAAFRQN